MKVIKKENESASSLMYRFSKKIQHSGVLKEAKKRRFIGRPVNKNRRRLSALKREKTKAEYRRKRKLGLL